MCVSHSPTFEKCIRGINAPSVPVLLNVNDVVGKAHAKARFLQDAAVGLTGLQLPVPVTRTDAQMQGVGV
jgi:hypothetical protein